MKVEHEEGDFYAVYDATSSMRKYFKFSVPTTHRRYESEPNPHWVVHSKYLDVADLKKEDPHTVLFLTKEAPGFMIEAAWKALAHHHHPDRGGSAVDFQRIKAAYEALKYERNNDGSSPQKETHKSS